jgi:hypothetical protein
MWNVHQISSLPCRTNLSISVYDNLQFSIQKACADQQNYVLQRSLREAGFPHVHNRNSSFVDTNSIQVLVKLQTYKLFAEIR